MGTIYKRGKNWYLDVRAHGKRIRKRVGSSKKIAMLALQDAEVKVARDEFGFAKNDIGINKFIDLFLDHSRANHQNSTTNRYRAVIDHFRMFVSTKRTDVAFMSQITPEVIDQYKVYRKDCWVNPNGDPIESDKMIKSHTRRGARAHTINFEVGVLRTIFNLAIKWDYLKENPTKNVTKLKVNDSKAPRFLSEDECRRLLEASPPHLQPVYFTFLHTGMRKAELENLQWSDIDFRRKRIKIQRKEFWQPKTGEREIPMSKSLQELLISLDRANQKGLRSEFVFPDKSGGKIKTKLREQLIRVAEKAGIYELTKLHALRHTFASHLVMKGVDLPTVKKLMGHSDIETTMIYAHLAPDHLAKAVDKLCF